MAKTNTAGSVVPPPGNTNNVANIQNPFSAVEPSSVNQISSVGNPSQAPNPYGALGGTTSFAGLGSFPGMPPQQQTNTGVPPPAPPPVNGITEEQLNLLRMLQAQGLPQDQLAAVVQALLQGGAPAPPPPNANGLGQPGWQGGNQGYGVGSNSTSRDFGGVRSPIGRYGKRSRSRSPPNYDRRRNASPRRRRDSPVYGEYNADASRDSGRNDGGRYGRGRDQANGFGQRSPARHRGSSSPPRQNNDLPPPGPRFIEHEPSLEPDRIKGQ